MVGMVFDPWSGRRTIKYPVDEGHVNSEKLYNSLMTEEIKWAS